MQPEDLDHLSIEDKEKLFSDLTSIFNNISLRFKYSSDLIEWNVRDHWENYDQIPEKGFIYGDCDCFALACRKECRKKSIPTRLVFCRVYVENKWSGHLVLECAGFILDCRQDTVVTNDSLDYQWVSISGYERNDKWRAVSL